MALCQPEPWLLCRAGHVGNPSRPSPLPSLLIDSFPSIINSQTMSATHLGANDLWPAWCSRSTQVCIKLFSSHWSVDQLPAGTARRVEEVLTSAAVRLTGQPLHVLEVGIRSGCILVSADLATLASPDNPVPTPPMDAMRFAEQLLPELLQHLPIDTELVSKGRPLLTLQLGDLGMVTVCWDEATSKFKVTQEAVSQYRDLVGSVHIGLVWQRRNDDQQQQQVLDTACTASCDRVSAPACYEACIMVVLLGVTKDNVSEIVGSHPNKQLADATGLMQTSPAPADAPSSSCTPHVLQVWALGQHGYLPVRVQECYMMPPGSQASLVKLCLTLPHASLVTHHAGGLPTCLQHVKLELWVAGSLKLDSTQVLLSGLGMQPELAPACSWWGLPVALASAAAQELDQVSQDMWTQRATRQDMVSQRSLVNDLVLWLDGCRAAQASTGSCVSQQLEAGAVTAGARCRAGNSLPPAVVLTLGGHLLSYAQRFGLRHTSALLQHPQGWTCLCPASPPGSEPDSDAIMHSRLPVPAWAASTCTRLFAAARPLVVAGLGFPCPVCEQLYGSTLQPLISQSCRYLYIVMATCGVVSLLREQRADEAGLFWALVVVWLALQGVKGVLLVWRHTSPSVLRCVSVLHLLAYMARMLGTALVALQRVPIPSSTVSQHEAGSWVLLYTLSSVSEHVPMRGMVPTWMVTSLSLLMSGLHLQLCCLVGVHTWVGSITGCLASTVLAPLLVDVHMRSRLMIRKQGSSLSSPSGAGKAAGSTGKELGGGGGSDVARHQAGSAALQHHKLE